MIRDSELDTWFLTPSVLMQYRTYPKDTAFLKVLVSLFVDVYCHCHTFLVSTSGRCAMASVGLSELVFPLTVALQRAGYVVPHILDPCCLHLSHHQLR